MDSQRRYEGSDLEALLAQVQRECGDGATILEANKLRTGGVGGFFSRERFEVVVDVAATSTTGITANTPTAGQTPADALQAALAATTPAPTSKPRTITSTPMTWSESEPTTSEPTTSKPASHLEEAVLAAIAAADANAEEVAANPPATSILELAEKRNTEERSPTPPLAPPSTASRPPVSTEGPAFADVLGQLAREALRDQEVPGDDTTFVPLATEAVTISTTVAPEPVPPALPHVEPTLTHAPSAAPVSTPAPTSVPVPVLAADGAGAREPALRGDAALARPTPQSPIAAALTCLGVPEHLLPASHALSDLRSDLVAALRWLPATDPLPTTVGSVIAVVGNADQAMATAQQVARELGCEEGDVILAGEVDDDEAPAWMRLRSHDEARERRRSWRRRSTPTVVAVAAPLGYDPAPWARPLLDALEPTIAWGVVSADRKAEDIRVWIDRLGGVDALALTETALTVSPATMLQLGIPIARLDGQRADPMAWTNLLLGRLAA